MKGASDSQIPGCSHSLSLTSEPPDITNWFPGYKFESFVLDTYDGLGGSQFRENETERCGSLLVEEMDREKEGILEDSERNGHVNDEFEVQTCSKMLDSLYCASLLSEPPHIKKWFSSYEYKSPMSDVEDFKVSATQESDSEKDESPMKGSKNKEEESFEELSNSGRRREEGEDEELSPNRSLLKDSLGQIDYKKPFCKIPNSSGLSALSGPPDVGNWFSSYAYKSPEFDENSGLVIGETEYEEDQFTNQSIKKEKETEFQKLGQFRSAEKEVFGLEVSSDVDLEFDSNSQVDKLENECKENGVVSKENFSSQDILCGQRMHCLGDRSANHDTNLTENVETSKLNDGRPQLGEPGFVSLKTNVELSSRDCESPSKLIYKQNENVEPIPENESAFISSGNDVQIIQVAAASTTKATNESNDMENGEQEGLRDGFVTTKKSRIVRSNDENSFSGQAEIPLACSKNKRASLEGDQDKNVAVRRKVLAERTNFEQTAAAMEVTGKWKCPQKGKPMIKPPLKQLRLEQWIRRQP